MPARSHNVAYAQVPDDVFDGSFPGAPEFRETMQYFEAHTYFGPDAENKIALAKEVPTKPFTDFATWAKNNMPAPA